MTRARLLTLAAFAGSIGWGTILPYEYAYVVDVQHWGSMVGVLTGTAFCIGAVLAAPIAGRLSDRYSQTKLAVTFQLVAALAAIGLGLAPTAALFLLGNLALGAAESAVMPVLQMLVLATVPGEQRRAAFASQFSANALGMAVGAFVAGHTISLDSQRTMLPAFVMAAAGFIVGALAVLIVGVLGRHGQKAHKPAVVAAHTSVASPGGLATYKLLWSNRGLRLVAIVAMLLAAGFYAQFETGLPAYALETLHVDPSAIGSASAVNCLVIVALQWAVVKLTTGCDGPRLLMTVASLWAVCWLLLTAAAALSPGAASAVFVSVFGVFAVGEMLFAPVLNPLVASLAPADVVGTTLGAVTALRTALSAIGPLIAGLLLALHLPAVFTLLHVAINLACVAVAWRLGAVLRHTPARVEPLPLDAELPLVVEPVDPATTVPA